MQYRSKMLNKTAIVLLGLMIAVIVFVAINNQQAKAIDGTQWETVRGYINEYYSGPQFAAGLDGEAGFRMGKVALWNRLDSNGDIQPNAGAAVGSAGTDVTGVLGEGDDMANRPILIDNLRTQTAYIPGTEFRCNWNTDEDCFSATSIAAIRQIVDNHQDAGFSTDIVDHCVSSQTAGPTTSGFGIIAQVPGGLATDTALTPNVYIADYSRNGWRNNLSVASGAETIAAPQASAGGFAAPDVSGLTACNAAATDLDLVRCQTNWAISSTGGNVGNGNSDLLVIGGAAQSVDIRTGTITTMDSDGANLQQPINTLFSTAGLANIDPTATTVLASRTQMGGTAAMGLKMLGYNLIAGGSINAGISRWNGTLGEQQVAFGDGLPLQSTTNWAAPGPVDTTGPSVTSVDSSNITTTTADIDRVAGEPATLKVEYGTTQGGPYTNTVNSTVLNASKTVGLSGLTPGTTYYYQATSYDGYANGTVSAEGSFITQVNPGVNDKVYYLPWYDSVTANGWIGDWIGVVNMDAIDTADVEIRIGGVTMDRQDILPGQDWDPPQNYPGEFGGPIEVICWDCATNATVLVVNQRALYGPTFSEILAVEKADLGTQYVFPWYDNVTANNVVGAWIMVTNTDDTTDATVEVTIGGTLVDTLTVAPGAAEFYIDATHTLIGGPVIVESTGVGGEVILVSQRVLYGNSFNEILGQKTA